MYSKLIREIIGSTWMIRENDARILIPYVENILSGASVNMSEFKSQEEVSATSDHINNKVIAILPIKGVITKYSFCGSMGLVDLDATLKRLDSDSTVDAIILDIDTPGGAASFLPNISATIQNMTTPVVSYYSGLCCSAGYYIASNTQAIFASNELDIVGSIGTMISFATPNPNQDNPDTLFHVINATKSTGKNKDFAEAAKGNYELIRSKMLDPFNDTFHSNVLSGRPGINPSVLDGSTFMSEEAISLGLIDGVKSFDEVVKYTMNLVSGIETPKMKFNFNIKSTMTQKSYFDKVSSLLGREVSSHDQMTSEDYAVVTEAIGANPAEEAGTQNSNQTDIDAVVTSKVAEAMSSFAPSMSAEEITSTINASVEAAIEAKLPSAIQTAMDGTAAASASDAGAIGGDGKTSPSWEDPENPNNKYLAEKLG